MTPVDQLNCLLQEHGDSFRRAYGQLVAMLEVLPAEQPWELNGFTVVRDTLVVATESGDILVGNWRLCEPGMPDSVALTVQTAALVLLDRIRSKALEPDYATPLFPASPG